MSSLIDPVGPLERGVYWRRRLIVLGVLLVVVLLLARACAGGGGDSPSADGAPVGASPTSSTSRSAEPSMSASSTPKPSPSQQSSSASRSTGPVLACKDSDIVVTAKPQRPNYAVGDTVNISYVVTTKNGVRCTRDIGGAADEVRVTSGSKVIWSSDYCSPGGKKDVRTIGPDEAFSVLVAWDGDVTASDCPDTRLPAPAGSYQVIGRNGAVFGPSASLTLG